MSELVYAADTWKAWSSLTEGERKLRAAKAIQAGDHDDLWLMTLAFLQFKGRKGTIASNAREATLARWERRIVKTYVYEF